MHYLCASAIMKWEQPWLVEWIEYHQLVGVEHFMLYANEEGQQWNQTREILRRYVDLGHVTLIHAPANAVQLPCYNDALAAMANRTRWLAFIDLDEFLFPIQDDSVPAVLSDYESYGAVAVNWCCFGSNGLRLRPRSTLNSFVRRAPFGFPPNRHVKVIVDPARAKPFQRTPHETDVDGGTVDENHKPVNGSFNDYTGRRLRLNHYPIKSWQDFVEVRCRRGIATPGQVTFTPEYFAGFDRNEILDEAIARRFRDRFVVARETL